MAELTTISNQFILKPISYEQKAEYWFSAEVSLSQDRKITSKGKKSFHIGDFQLLINGIKSLINNEKDHFFFDPIEPYLKIDIEKKNENYVFKIDFYNGPIFNKSQHKRLTIVVSRDNLSGFVDQLKNDLEKIDPDLDLTRNYSL